MEICYLRKLEKKLTDRRKGNNFRKACLNYAENILKNKAPVIFDYKHFRDLIGDNDNVLKYYIMLDENFYYKKYKIIKKSGGERTIVTPSFTLKYIQRWILDNILYCIPVSENSHGFTKKKSIFTNAEKHLSKDVVINIDIKDFFPTIKFKEVFRVFKKLGYTKHLSFIFAKLCTYQKTLPQGAPTSPYLSNIISSKIDKRIMSLVKKYYGDYTRYADDITISGKYGIEKCIPLVKQIIKSEGFELNEKKFRISYSYQKQEVTGLIVNSNKVKINKKYKNSVKQEIFFCKKYGVEDHLIKIESKKSFYKEHLYGKVYFINMVEPELGKFLLKQLDEIEWSY